MNKLFLAAQSILTASMFLLLAQGCGTQTDTTNIENYFPHNDGYSWTYTVIATMETTEEGISTSVTEETYTFNGTAEVGGIIVQKYLRQGASESEYYFIDSSGVYYFGAESFPTTEGQPVLSYPLSVGKKWTGLLGGSEEVVAYEAVQTPLGLFNAYKIRFVLESPEIEVDYAWYASGAGKVKNYFKGIVTVFISFEGDVRLVPATFEITAVLKEKNF